MGYRVNFTENSGHCQRKLHCSKIDSKKNVKIEKFPAESGVELKENVFNIVSLYK
jgi:hypothetical protein